MKGCEDAVFVFSHFPWPSLIESQRICLWTVRLGLDMRYDVVLIWH